MKKCPNIPIPTVVESCNEIQLAPIKHSFKDGKYYRNDVYFGDVVYSDEKIIQVKCNNGSKYMQGQIISFTLN